MNTKPNAKVIPGRQDHGSINPQFRLSGGVRNRPARLVVTLVLLAAPLAFAQTYDAPGLINYQGKLTDNLGNPVGSGYYEVQFKIWSHPTRSEAGDFKWGRTLAMHVVTNGMFNVLLSDDGAAISNVTTKLVDVFDNPERYLGLTITKALNQAVSSPAEIQPRQQLVSAPYALHASTSGRSVEAKHATNADYSISAGNATTLGNLTTNDYVKTTQSSQTLTGNLKINGKLGINTDPWPALDIAAGVGNTGSGDSGAIGLSYASGGYRHFIRSRHYSAGNSGNAIDFYINNSNTSGASTKPGTGNFLALTIDGTGYLGIMQMTPDRPLTVRGVTLNNSEWVSFQDSGGTTKWHINNNSGGLNFVETGTSTSRLMLEPGGDVGIGTTAPQAKLDVQGGARVQGDLNVTGKMQIAGSAPIEFNTIHISDISASDNDTIYLTTTTYPTNKWAAAVVGWKYQADIYEGKNGNYRIRALPGYSMPTPWGTNVVTTNWMLEFAIFHQGTAVSNIYVDMMYIRKELVNDKR